MPKVIREQIYHLVITVKFLFRTQYFRYSLITENNFVEVVFFLFLTKIIKTETDPYLNMLEGNWNYYFFIQFSNGAAS